MTDRELLKQAAEAAGFIVGTICDLRGVLMLIDGEEYDWNPLDDDADALRLAVKLDIAITPGQVKTGVNWWVRPGLIEQDGLSELHGTDPYAATRRAIVRAAAQIGKGSEG